MISNNWLKLGKTWYYLNENGAMHTGWLHLGGSWYYMDASGAMLTGWAYLAMAGTTLVEMVPCTLAAGIS